MTALKFAELTVKAGFPKGVINIVPGSGDCVCLVFSRFSVLQLYRENGLHTYAPH